MKFGLIGASYESSSLNADAQKTVNWFPEKIESDEGKNTFVLYPTPGTKAFAVVDNQVGVAIASVEVEHGAGNKANISRVEVKNTYGPNLAGLGVDEGYSTILRPSAYSDTVPDRTWWNVLDNDPATFDYVGSQWDVDSNVGNKGVSVFFGIPAAGVSWNSGTLRIQYSTVINGTDGVLEYSWDSGSTWHTITSITDSTYQATPWAVALPDKQDCTKIQVRFRTGVPATNLQSANANIYEIWVEIVGAEWTTPQNLTSATNYASVTVPVGVAVGSNKLAATLFGFAIPTGQTVSKFVVTVDAAYSGDVSGFQIISELIKSGVPLSLQSQTVSATGSKLTFIFPVAGVPVPPSDVNNSDFGVRFTVVAPDASAAAGTVSLRNCRMTPTVSPYALITTTEDHGYGVGNNIGITHLVNAQWLNDQTLTLDSVPSATTFTALFSHANYSGADAGVAWDGGLVPPYAIIGTKVVNIFAAGTKVTFSGLGNAGFLNGHSVTVATVTDPSHFTAPFNNPDYGPAAETQGKVLLGAVSGFNPLRGQHEINGRAFAVAGPNLFELFADQNYTMRGGVIDDGGPVSFASTAEQLLVCAAGHLYLLALATNAFTTISDSDGAIADVSKIDYVDGYFVGLVKDSRQFRISGIEDGSSWDPLDKTTISVFPDNAQSMIVDHREIWIFGGKKTVVYYNSGNPDFPFDVIGSGFIDQGCAALFSPVRIDNSVFWVGKDERGTGMVWRARGYTPGRVSDHALETAMQGYSRLDDVVGYGFQMNGHSYYHLYFPTARKSWRYDCATATWCEVGYWNNGVYEAHHSQCHCFAFGKHLVGDWGSGSIYELSTAYSTDNGNPLRRVRRSPHVFAPDNRLLHGSKLEILAETGLGLDSGQGSDPQLMVRWSDDGGHTWGKEHSISLGKTGEYKTRAILRRLGRFRDRVFDISCSEPIPVRILDGILEAQ